MKKQKGAALIVVLSLLTMSLMLGLSGMQSSLIDERLAGNYKAQAEAQMNAETGLSSFFSENRRCDAMEEVIDGGSFGSESVGYQLHNDNSRADSGTYEVFMLGFSGEARSFVEARGICEDTISFLSSRSAYSCIDGACGFKQGAGQTGGISGFDHSLPDDPKSCNVEADGPNDRAGAIFSDAEFSSQGYTEEDVDNLNVSGDPNYLAGILGDDGMVDSDQADKFFSADYLSDLFEGVSCREGDENFKKCRSDAVISAVSQIKNENELILNYFLEGDWGGNGNVVVVNEGQTFELSGRFDGVVLLNGGTLLMKGNDCVVGAVLGHGTAQVESKGRPAIIGTLIASDLEFEGSGRPNVSYSSEALERLDDEVGVVVSDFEITAWEDRVGVEP